MVLNITAPWIKNKVRCQNGYVYVDTPFWNKDKQQSDHKREYIGKYDGHYNTQFINRYDRTGKPVLQCFIVTKPTTSCCQPR